MAAGGTISGYYVGYGQRKLAGPAAFVDLDTRRHFGIEAETRWLNFPRTANVNASTYVGGLRLSPYMPERKFYPYAKVMAGLGRFNFPYNYGSGTYFAIAAGGGLDMRLTHRMRIRVADFEYQDWPTFTYGSMPSWGISSGVRFRVF